MNISDEFIVQPWQNGIKLIKPSKYSNIGALSVGALLSLPLNIFFVNKASECLKLNEATMKICGLQSIKDCIGKTMRAIATKKSAEFCIRHDQQVLKTSSLKITEVPLQRLDGEAYHIISFKFPCYDNNHNLMGVLGCSFAAGIPGYCNLSESLTLITQIGFLNASPRSLLPGIPIDGIYLSKRESECLHYLMRGKSIKAIACSLGLSVRTIEHYLDRIKFKMKVQYKSELIEKAFHYFEEDRGHV